MLAAAGANSHCVAWSANNLLPVLLLLLIRLPEPACLKTVLFRNLAGMAAAAVKLCCNLTRFFFFLFWAFFAWLIFRKFDERPLSGFGQKWRGRGVVSWEREEGVKYKPRGTHRDLKSISRQVSRGRFLLLFFD